MISLTVRSGVVVNAALFIRLPSSTFLRGLNLHHGKGFDHSGAAARWTFSFLLDPLVVFGQRPDLFEILVALFAVKFVSRHVSISHTSALNHDLNAIDDFLDAKHTPGISLGHLFHRLTRNQTVQRYDPILRRDMDLGSVDDRIFF
jgi:hypothetical protein